MSQENVKVVREAFRAWVERDPDAVVECFHPDVELLLPRNVLEGGSYRGHEGVRRALTDAFQTWEDVRFDIREVKAIDDRVIAVGRTTAVGKGDAPAVDYQSAYLCRMREGRIDYLRPYQSHADALRAAGLSEQDAYADS
jgi:ketosteroid isomerase-like protein